MQEDTFQWTDKLVEKFAHVYCGNPVEGYKENYRGLKVEHKLAMFKKETLMRKDPHHILYHDAGFVFVNERSDENEAAIHSFVEPVDLANSTGYVYLPIHRWGDIDPTDIWQSLDDCLYQVRQDMWQGASLPRTIYMHPNIYEKIDFEAWAEEVLRLQGIGE